MPASNPFGSNQQGAFNGCLFVSIDAVIARICPASNPFGGNSSGAATTTSFGNLAQAPPVAPAFGQSAGFGRPFGGGSAESSNPFSSGGGVATTTTFGAASGFGGGSTGGSGAFGAPAAPSTAFGSASFNNRPPTSKSATTFGNNNGNTAGTTATTFGSQNATSGFGRGGFNNGIPPPMPPPDDSFGFAPMVPDGATTFGQPQVRSKRQQQPRGPPPSSGTAFGNSSTFGSSATPSPAPSPPSTAFGSQAAGIRVRKKTNSGPQGDSDSLSSGDNPFVATTFGQPNRVSPGPSGQASSSAETVFGRDKKKKPSSGNPFGGGAGVSSADPFGGGAALLDARMNGASKKTFGNKSKRIPPLSTGATGEQGAKITMTMSKKLLPTSNGHAPPDGSDTDPGPFAPGTRKKPQRSPPPAAGEPSSSMSFAASGNDDSNKAELSSAVNLDGTCVDMCSPAERELHIRVDELSVFEKCFPDQPGRERDLIIKRFQRSSADHKLDIPSEVRPPGVLRRTQLYIEQEIMDRERAGVDPRFNPPRLPEIIELYNFCWDRFRMIRKDFVLQNYRGAGGRVHPIVLDVHERVARYHILSEHELIEVPSFVAQQNMEQLGQTLKSLNELYDESRNLGDPSYLSPFEAEFRAYFILCTLDNGRGLDVLKFVKGLHKSIVDSPQVKFAMKVFVARHTSDYFQFFVLLRQATYLQSCLLFRYLPSIRSTALQRMNRAFRNQPYPLVDLTNLLCFDDLDHAGSVCSQHGLEITQQDEDDEESYMVQFGGDFETGADLAMIAELRYCLLPKLTTSRVAQKSNCEKTSDHLKDYLRRDICRGVTEYYPEEYPALSHLIQNLEFKERARLYPSQPLCEDKYSYFVDYSSSGNSHEANGMIQPPASNQHDFATSQSQNYDQDVADRDDKMHELETIAKRKAELERNQQMVMQRIAQLQREKEEKARAEQERKAAATEVADREAKAEAEAKAKAREQAEREAEALRRQQELEEQLREQEKQRQLEKLRKIAELEKQQKEAEEAAKREREAEARRQEALKAKLAEEKRRREAELREEEARIKAAEELERRRRQQAAEEQARLQREAALEAKRQEELARVRAEQKRKLRIKKQKEAILKLRFHAWKKYVKASKQIPAPVKLDASRFLNGVSHFKPKNTIQWLFKDVNAASTIGTRLRNPSELIKLASDHPVETTADSWRRLDVLSIVGAQLRKARKSDSSPIGWKLVVADLLDDQISSFGVWCASRLGVSVTDAPTSYQVFCSEADGVAVCCRYVNASFMDNFEGEHHKAAVSGASALLLPLALSEIQDSGRRQRWFQYVGVLLSVIPRHSQVCVLILDNIDSSSSATREALGSLEKSIRQLVAKTAPFVNMDVKFVSGDDKQNVPLIDQLQRALVSLSERWIEPLKLKNLDVRELLENGISSAINRCVTSSISVQKDVQQVTRSIYDDLRAEIAIGGDEYPPTELQDILTVPGYGKNTDQNWRAFERVVSVLMSTTIEPEIQQLLERHDVCNRYFAKIASFIDRIFASSPRGPAEVSTFELKKLIYNQLIPIHGALMTDNEETKLVPAEVATTMLPWKKFLHEIYSAFLESVDDLSLFVSVDWRPQYTVELSEATVTTDSAAQVNQLVKEKVKQTEGRALETSSLLLKSLKRSFGVAAADVSSSSSFSSRSQQQQPFSHHARKEDARIKRLRQEIARERAASARFQQLLRQELFHNFASSTCSIATVATKQLDLVLIPDFCGTSLSNFIQSVRTTLYVTQTRESGTVHSQFRNQEPTNTQKMTAKPLVRRAASWSELPPVLLAQALEFADVNALLALECTSQWLRALLREFHLWRALACRLVTVAQDNRPLPVMKSANDWKRLLRLNALPPRDDLPILRDVRGCSSVDNPAEVPENTLTRSSCEIEVDFLSRSILAQQPVIYQEWAQRIQLKCGCARGRPCYWSTTAPDSLISSVLVAPYRVYWYPGNPTYSPMRLSFTFYELSRDADGNEVLGSVVYVSPEYDAIQDMKLQEFTLPRRVFLARGVMRLNMFDRQQDIGSQMLEWHRAEHLPPYYICLSYVGAHGLIDIGSFGYDNNSGGSVYACTTAGQGKRQETKRVTSPDSGASPAIELKHTIGFSAVPNAIHYHPSGLEYLYSSGGSILATSFQDAHSQLFLRGHDAPIACLALSKSGCLLASGERGKQSADVLAWDYPSKRFQFRLLEHDHGIAALAFSDDERLLCSIGVPEDSRLYIWDVATGNICATQQKLSAVVTAVTFGGMARDIKRRDTTSYQFATAGLRMLLLWVLNPMTGEHMSHKIDTSGDFSVVNVKTKRLVKNVPACSCGIHSIAHFDAGVLIGGGDGSVLHFDREYVDTCHVLLDAAVSGLALNAAQTEAVVGTQAGSIFAVSLCVAQRNLHASLLFENHSSAVVHVVYASGVSDRFATVSRDCTIRVWDASDYAVTTKCSVTNAGLPTCLQYSLDVLLTGWTDGAIRCHSADTAHLVWSIDNAHTGGVTAMVPSHNQRFIVSAGVGGEVRVWDLRRRDMVSHLKERAMAVTHLALYGDDMHVLSCSRDRGILCWDLRNECRISSRIQRVGGINTVALSNNQKLVLSAGQEKRISYWDLRIESPVHIIHKAHDEEATCIAVAHTLDIFATGGNDRLVKIWDFTSGELLLDGVGHSGNSRSIAFSPDDRQLVSVGDDGSILIWNVSSRSLVRMCHSMHHEDARSKIVKPDSCTSASYRLMPIARKSRKEDRRQRRPNTIAMVDELPRFWCRCVALKHYPATTRVLKSGYGNERTELSHTTCAALATQIHEKSAVLVNQKEEVDQIVFPPATAAQGCAGGFVVDPQQIDELNALGVEIEKHEQNLDQLEHDQMETFTTLFQFTHEIRMASKALLESEV
ncbi:Nuclear protein export factor, partial [Globisporangium splendens]